MKGLLIIFLFLGPGCFAQEEPEHAILNYFSATLRGDEVYLTWEIKGGNQCNGIQILRSTDTIGFSVIGDITGVCGSADFAQTYSYTDKDPVADHYNYYKIELGNQGYSSTDVVHYIKLSDAGYRLYPNPVEDQSILYFDNPDNQGFTLEIFDQTGRLVSSRKLSGTNRIALTNELAHQTSSYIFKLTSADNTRTITGRFFIH